MTNGKEDGSKWPTPHTQWVERCSLRMSARARLRSMGLLPNDQNTPADNLPAADIGAGGVRASFRSELDRTRYSVVDEDWAGGVPAQYGVAPRVRIGQGKWFGRFPRWRTS